MSDNEEMDPLAGANNGDAEESKINLMMADGDPDLSAFQNQEEKEDAAAATAGDKDKGAEEDDDAVAEEDKSAPTDSAYVRKKKRLRRRIKRMQRAYQRNAKKRKEEENRIQQVLDTRGASGKHQEMMVDQRRTFDDLIETLSGAFGADDLERAKELTRYKDGSSHAVDLFIHVCRRGNVDVVKSLVTRLGFEPNCYDVYDKTGMILATAENQTAMVQYLASELKADVNYVPANGMFSDGVSPLMIASSANNVDIMKILLEEKGDPNQADHRGRTAVHRACQKGHMDALEALMAAGADLNKQDLKGNTPCLIACKFGHEGLLRALVDAGADPRIGNKKGHTPFARAAMRGSIEMIEYLMRDCGVAINTTDENGECPIANAMRANRMDVVRYLALNTRTDINIKDKFGRSPVLLAVVLGNLELVSFFTLECNEFIDTGDWALVYMYAVKQKDVDMIRHLVFNCGYELQEADVKSLRLYERAVADSDVEMTQKIVKSLGDKFEVDAKDEENNGQTPLMRAVINSDLMMVKYLHDELGANIDAVNDKGASPLILGVRNNSSLEVLDLLINDEAYLCDMFMEDEDGKSAFDIALDLGIRGKNIEMVRLILVELAEHNEGLAKFLAGEKNRSKIQFLFGQQLIPEENLNAALKYITENRLKLDPFVLLELKKATKSVSSADEQAKERADKVVRTRSVAKCLMLEMENDPGFLMACTNIIKGALLNFRPFSDDMLIAICMYERKHHAEEFGRYGGVLAQLDAALSGSIESGKGSQEYKWFNKYLLDSAAWFEYPPKREEEEAKEREEEKTDVMAVTAEENVVETRGRAVPVTQRSGDEESKEEGGRGRSSSAAVSLLENGKPGVVRQVSAIAEEQEEIEKEKDDRVPCLFVDMLLRKYTARMDQEGVKLSEHVFDSFAEEREEFDEIRKPVRELRQVYDKDRGFYEEMVSIAKYEEHNLDRQDDLERGIKPDKSELDLGYNDANIQFYDLSVNLNQLVSFANQINDEFQDYVKRICADGMDPNIYSFRRAPVKTLTRCREKCETDYFEEHYPTSARLLDLVRCSVTFEHVAHLETAMEFFARVAAKVWDPEDESEGIRGVARIKNGLAELGDLSREEPIAYHDIKINAIYYSKIGRKSMIVEIQLILKPFLMAKKHMHRLYKVIRSYDVFRIAVPMANKKSVQEGIYDEVDYNEM